MSQPCDIAAFNRHAGQILHPLRLGRRGGGPQFIAIKGGAGSGFQTDPIILKSGISWRPGRIGRGDGLAAQPAARRQRDALRVPGGGLSRLTNGLPWAVGGLGWDSRPVSWPRDRSRRRRNSRSSRPRTRLSRGRTISPCRPTEISSTSPMSATMRSRCSTRCRSRWSGRSARACFRRRRDRTRGHETGHAGQTLH